ncbi:MAG TPA: nucleotide disphospho-sugar-binding domain-containing protein [Pseudonocardiaceae bacterium]
MRVLFTTWAWPSHLYAMVPLAWACRAAGHEVLVASQPGLLDEIVRTGLPAAAVGQDVDAVEMVRGYVLPSETAGDGDGKEPRLGHAPRTGKGPRALQMFLAHAESMVDDLVALTRGWRADVVVFEPTALAGPIAAAAAGVPAVRHLYGVDLMLRARPILPDLLADLAERHGVTEFDPFGVTTVDPAPPGLRVPGADYPRLSMQYVPFNGPGVLPRPLPDSGGRPRICVTWGYTMAKLAPSRFLAGQVVQALHKADLDAQIVLAVSSRQQEMLPPLPDDVHVAVDTPLNLLLPRCDLVVTHGGAGTVLTSLRNGLPLLLIPQLPDHAGHAARVAAAGAGELLPRDDATPERIAEQVATLLGERGDAVRDAARELQCQIREQPTPAAVAEELASLVQSATTTH